MKAVDPTCHAEARALARRYVGELVAQGWTAEKAQNVMQGTCGPGFPGWMIRAGKITVPCAARDQWSFSFGELERELRYEVEQPLLF